MVDLKYGISVETNQTSYPAVGMQSPLILVEFSNANVKSGSQKCLQYMSYKSFELNSLSRSKRMLVASNQNLQYTGSNYESEMSTVTSSVLKVGVFNKHSRKMKLYDVDYFHLKPMVKYHLDEKTTNKSWSEKSQDLALAFGSKNKIRSISSRLKYESTGNSSIEGVISTEFIEAESQKTNTAEVKPESELIPTQNRNAKSVEEVYNIFDNYLFKQGKKVVQRENVISTRFCFFIVHFLELYFQGLSLHKAKLLCYLNYMMIIFSKSYKDWRKKDPAPEIPQPFKRKLMEKFSVNRSMPQSMKDKLHAHAMVLALTVNNYQIDGNIWAASIQVPIKRLILVAYTLGCHVSEIKKEETKSIVLKLPLYKYEPRGKFKK